MPQGVSFLTRPNSTTGAVGHSYDENIGVNPHEKTFTDSRFYTLFDLSVWDGVSDININGPASDGTIARLETVTEGDEPIESQL